MMLKLIGLYISQEKSSTQFPLDNFSNFIKKNVKIIVSSKSIKHKYDNSVDILANSLITKRLHKLLSNSLLWHNRHLTIFIRNKAITNFGRKKDRLQNTFFVQNKYEKHMIGYRLFVRSFGNFYGIKLLQACIEMLFLVEYICKQRDIMNQYKLIILSYGARIESEFDFIIWVSNRFKGLNLVTFCIQENWDNVFSKKIFFQHPQIFGSWGKQSTEFLKNKHHLRSTIYEVGSARLTKHWEARNISLHRDLNFSNNNMDVENSSQPKTFKILLLGTGDARYDKQLCEKLLANKDTYNLESKNNLIIYYRPHPFARQNYKHFWYKVPKYLNIIPPTKGDYDDLVKLILKSNLVITLYSTTVLDALILNKLVLIPAFVGKNNYINSIDFIEESWFRGLSDFVLLAKTELDFYELITKVEELSVLDDSKNQQDMTKVLDYYVANKDFFIEVETIILKHFKGLDD